MPANEHLPGATALLSTQGLSGCWKKATIIDRGQRPWSSRRFTLVTLQKADMEHVMNTGSIWELKAVGNLANTLQNAERACIPWSKLPLGLRF